MTVPFTARVPTLWHGPRARATMAALTAGRDPLVLADAAGARPLPAAAAARTMTVDASGVDELGVVLIAD